MIRICILALVVAAVFFFSRQERGNEQAPSVEASYTNTTTDEIVIDSPTPGQTIASPITITGQARGSWFFEATAPVVLVDWDGLIIAEGYVTATENWMTAEFVPFAGQLEFVTPTYGQNGALILRASNPSGLSEFDRAVEIPLLFF